MALYKKTSKLPARENIMIRPRIDAMLEAGIQTSSISVHGGAGFGKTQAVASFLERSEYLTVWHQMTLLDNLPMRFWESFVYTISLHRGDLAGRLEKLGFPDTLYKFDKFLRLFTENLYEDENFVVYVVDDFHLITNHAVLDFFEHFLSANLENLCVVFITRKPELPPSCGKTHILTNEDLRFTPEETRQYFDSIGIRIKNNADFDEIYQYTKGWPMATYLLGLQMAKNDMRVENHLTNSQQIIFSLIDKEVFSKYNSTEQDFFIILSQLNFFPRELVSGVMWDENAIPLLHGNAFVSYDHKANSYYLHQLFLDFLSERRHIVGKKRINNVLGRAGAWCLKHKFFVDATNYFERCGEKEKIVQVMQGFEGMRHSRADAEFFIQHIKKFSEEFMNRNIMCRIVYSMLFLNNLEIEKAKEQMRLVWHVLNEQDDSDENNQLRGEAHIASGLICMALGTDEFFEHFKEADSLLPNASGHWDTSLRLVAYSNALNISSPEPGSAENRVKQLFENVRFCTRILNDAGYGVEFLARAEYNFFRGNHRAAQVDAYKAMYKAEERNRLDIIENAWFLLMRIFLATGNAKKVEGIVNHLQQNAHLYNDSMQKVSDVSLGWFYSEIGELDKVEGWIIHEEESSQPPISIDKDALLQIRCLIEEKDYFKAYALAGRLEAILRKRNLLISLIYVQVCKAVIAFNLDETDKVMEYMEAAYCLAYGNGLIMPFIEFGHKTRAMLNYVRKTGSSVIPDDWIARVHIKASTYAKRHSYIVSQFAYLKAQETKEFGLTHREIELLRNMSQGLTRDEIAESMYLSPHTIKSMLKTVYNKIGAINGADAVRLAALNSIL